MASGFNGRLVEKWECGAGVKRDKSQCQRIVVWGRTRPPRLHISGPQVSSLLFPPTQVVYVDVSFHEPPPLNYTLQTRRKSIAIFWTLIFLDCICMPIILYFALWYATGLSHNAGKILSITLIIALLTTKKSSASAPVLLEPFRLSSTLFAFVGCGERIHHVV